MYPTVVGVAPVQLRDSAARASDGRGTHRVCKAISSALLVLAVSQAVSTFFWSGLRSSFQSGTLLYSRLVGWRVCRFVPCASLRCFGDAPCSPVSSECRSCFLRKMPRSGSTPPMSSLNPSSGKFSLAADSSVSGSPAGRSMMKVYPRTDSSLLELHAGPCTKEEDPLSQRQPLLKCTCFICLHVTTPVWIIFVSRVRALQLTFSECPWGAARISSEKTGLYVQLSLLR